MKRSTSRALLNVFITRRRRRRFHGHGAPCRSASLHDETFRRNNYYHCVNPYGPQKRGTYSEALPGLACFLTSQACLLISICFTRSLSLVTFKPRVVMKRETQHPDGQTKHSRASRTDELHEHPFRTLASRLTRQHHVYSLHILYLPNSINQGFFGAKKGRNYLH